MAWTVADIPSQRGRAAVVTGTGGLGWETALALAQAGAEVILAGRNPEKGAEAVARIRARVPQAGVVFEELDLAHPASIRAFADRLQRTRTSLDLLVNNAGVMALPQRRTAADGSELQFSTNYLGPFALTARLLPLLRQAARPRVVNVSSLAHRSGRIDFDDLQGERAYAPYRAYAQSKFAQVVFTLELQRRSEAHGWGLTSAAAHPGFASTDLIANGPGEANPMSRVMGLLTPLLWQSAADGALPTLYAATAPAAAGGGFYGPAGFMEIKGPPKPARIAPAAKDPALGARLWQVSEQLTGTAFG